MLEIVFSDSAAGALSVAQGGGRYIGGASSVLVPGEGEPSQEDRERLLRRFEERERRGWEQAVPLAGRPAVRGPQEALPPAPENAPRRGFLCRRRGALFQPCCRLYCSTSAPPSDVCFSARRGGVKAGKR